MVTDPAMARESPEIAVLSAMAEGQRELLLRMLHRRFGALPEAVTRQVARASSDALGQWSEDLLFADSLAARFGADAGP